MKIELSLNGARIFLLSVGLLLVVLLMFFAGMVFTVGRVRSGTGIVSRYVPPREQPTPPRPQVAAVPPPHRSVRRLRPTGTRQWMQRMTPIPVLSHPPATPVSKLREDSGGSAARPVTDQMTVGTRPAEWA